MKFHFVIILMFVYDILRVDMISIDKSCHGVVWIVISPVSYFANCLKTDTREVIVTAATKTIVAPWANER